LNILSLHIESLIFCSSEPVTLEEIKQCLDTIFETEVQEEHIQQAIDLLQEKYSSEEFSFTIEKLSGGFQFFTKPTFQSTINRYLNQKSKKKLSPSAMETLSIIAYKQPITKIDAEQIRGVSCDYAIQKLLEKGLIDIKGKAETVGKPLLYGTSKKFMEYFGINSLDELPTPKDFMNSTNEIGEPTE